MHAFIDLIGVCNFVVEYCVVRRYLGSVGISEKRNRVSFEERGPDSSWVEVSSASSLSKVESLLKVSASAL